MEESGKPVAKGLLLVGVATMLANGAAYLLSMIGARALSVPDYGALGALLSVSIIGSTIALAAQAVGARQMVFKDSDQTNAIKETSHLSFGATTTMAALGIALSLPLASMLAVPTPAVLLTFAAMAASIPGFAALGILQGREDHRGFGIAYSGIGLIRAAGGIAAMFVVPTVTSACLGIFIGSLAGSALSMAVGKIPISMPRTRGPLARELLHNSSALVALFAFANSDVLLARVFLDQHSSGEYAVGALIAKIAFFLPYAIITIYFPKMSAKEGRRRAFVVALLMTAAVSVSVTAACFLFSDPLVWILAGTKYVELAPLAWMFALGGGIFAVMQVVLYAGFSTRAKIVGLVPLTALAAQILVVSLWSHETVLQILVVTIAAASLSTIVGGWIELRPLREDAGLDGHGAMV